MLPYGAITAYLCRFCHLPLPTVAGCGTVGGVDVASAGAGGMRRPLQSMPTLQITERGEEVLREARAADALVPLNIAQIHPATQHVVLPCTRRARARGVNPARWDRTIRDVVSGFAELPFHALG